MSWQNEIWPKRPCLGLHPGIYKENMKDKLNGQDPFVHYLQSNSPSGIWRQKLITASISQKEILNQIDCALHIHIYYEYQVKEILERINYNLIKPDLYISCNKASSVNEIQQKVEDAGLELKDIQVTPNRGRDIGPLITRYGKLLDSKYHIYGHIHTKKSTFLKNKDGELWKEFLLGNVIGTTKYQMADKIIYEMNQDPKLGLVFPQDPTCVGWNENFFIAKKLAHHLDIDNLPRYFDFPIGNMFWAKKGALSSLYNLNISWEDYPKEPIKYDGTVLHAIERLIPIIAKRSGFDYRMTHVEGLSR